MRNEEFPADFADNADFRILLAINLGALKLFYNRSLQNRLKKTNR